MKTCYPAYYRNFRCSAGKCTDSCCMHWEIDIDEKSLEKYKSCNGVLSDRLRAAVAEEDGTAHFILGEDERCPFLNENNLCDIILNMGKESLCYICATHPRFVFRFGGREEWGVGLCCEEAAKLILNPAENDRIICIGETSDDTAEDFELADCIPDILRARDALLANSALYSAAWNRNADNAHSEALRFNRRFFSQKNIRALTECFLSLEALSDRWTEALQYIHDNAQLIMKRRADFLKAQPEAPTQYERLFRYFIFRHFMKLLEDCFDEDDLAYCVNLKLMLALRSVCFIELLDVAAWQKNKAFTAEDQINICKLFSQEIEYSAESTEALELFEI